MLAAKPSSIRIDTREPATTREREAAALLQRWLDEDNDHDERFWPVLEEELEGNRLRCRE